MFYDSAGNQTRNTSNGTTVSWYGADNKLRAVEQRGLGGSALNWLFDEYRYDAVGRRVLVRTRSTCLSGDCRNVIRRTIWDGAQEAGEIQGDGSDGATASTLENDAPGGTNDSRLFGRVVYVHGLTLDQPLGVVRVGYAAQGFYGGLGPLGLALHYNWRGAPDLISFPDGSGALCPNGTASGCVETTLPAALSAYQLQYYHATSWYGSLVDRRSDATGQQYLRNRYYDPASGHFTQEDPLGLAGGLNSYGFAGGDPVNYADPFGLCPSGLSAGRSFLCNLIEATSIAAGTDIGGVLGGGAGLFTGPGAIVATPAGAYVGAAAGAGVGALAGRAITNVLFADAEGGHSSENQGAQDKKLGNGEIKRLQDADIDIHDLKGGKNASKYDLYKNRDGDILVKPKGGRGPGDPTGLNINDFK